jgi:hypothetical protein
VTRRSEGRVPEYQDYQENRREEIVNLMPGCPDIHYLIS